MKPNGLFGAYKRAGLKPNGLFGAYKRNLKPNGLFGMSKKGMNEDEDLDQEFVNYVEDRTDSDYDKDGDEPYGGVDLEDEQPAKREDSDFWAARGKKEDINFWATRG